MIHTVSHGKYSLQYLITFFHIFHLMSSEYTNKLKQVSVRKNVVNIKCVNILNNTF